MLASGRAQLAHAPGEFIRAYGNRRTTAAERLISAELAERATFTREVPAGRLAFGAAVSFDRDELVVVGAVLDGAGVPWCEVLEVRETTTGGAELLAALTDRHGGHVVVAVDGTEIPVEAASLCLHGDSPGAVAAD